MHYDREMEVKNWSHPAKQVKIIEGHENSPHFIQVYTDSSKSDARVGSGIAIFSENNLMATLKYRLHSCCTNNQAKQMAILKALEHIQYSKTGEKTILVYTDSQITLKMLQNQKIHMHLIEQIRTKVFKLKRDEWKVEFSWIRAHAGYRGNELANWQKKQKAIGPSKSAIPESQRVQCCVT